MKTLLKFSFSTPAFLVTMTTASLMLMEHALTHEEQDHQGEARVRTRHEPLRWTQIKPQQPLVDGPQVFPHEADSAPHESEQAFLAGAGGVGETVVPHDQQQQTDSS